MKTIDVVERKLGLFKIKHYGQLPESWTELTPDQIIAVAEMYLNQATQLKSLAKLTGIPFRVIKKLSDIEILAILDELQFLTDYRPRNCFIITELGCLISPKPKLDAMTWEQFIYVDTYYEDFVGRMNDEGLNIFVAHLYLRKNEAFDHSLLQKRATQKLITSIPYATKYAVAINYRLIREWLAVIYPLIFQKKEQTTPSPPTPSKDNVWIKIHQAIIGDDIANYEKYSKAPLHLVFRYLTDKIKHNARKKH